MSKEIMQQALAAFEAIMFEKDAESCQIIAKNARYSLREALAQPEQEHIECGYDEIVGLCTNNPCCEQAQPEQTKCPRCNEVNPAEIHTCSPQREQKPVDIHCPSCLHPFYIVPVAKREWVGLTDEERNEMIGRIQHDQFTRQRDLIGSTQIITEMYLKEKNT